MSQFFSAIIRLQSFGRKCKSSKNSHIREYSLGFSKYPISLLGAQNKEILRDWIQKENITSIEKLVIGHAAGWCDFNQKGELEFSSESIELLAIGAEFGSYTEEYYLRENLTFDRFLLPDSQPFTVFYFNINSKRSLTSSRSSFTSSSLTSSAISSPI
ncbi:MAG: hypothetical protein IMF19_13385, partial [Proteobacteria bacterium]|nr:hypothetical protein [Pseudomonadota bacterium]